MFPIRVLIVDDFAGFRQIVSSLLRTRPELQIVGEASDGLEAIQKAKELHPDLILLDIGLPSLNGIESARQIRKISPKSRIIFVSQESAPEVVHEALKSGAQGYVVKSPQLRRNLLAAMEAVISGKQFFSTLTSQTSSSSNLTPLAE